MSVLIVTSVGDIVIDLFTDKCPLTSKNFLKLCKIKYYNGCLFHTVQKDFTAQTGDPTGTGAGGDSIYKFLYGDQARFFGDEIHLDLKHSKTGAVGMASAGEDLNASQFYFTLRDDLDYLDGKHTVFGEVAEGLETLTRINDAYVDEKSRPFKNIRIKHTYILDDPFDDPPQLAELIPEASPEGKPKDEVEDEVRLEDDWVPMDEQLGPAELEEVLREKEARSHAVVLESIGDIPEAEIKPPDNVLFVCKLNPVTEDEDLHTIFSRFGTVISSEIIRDYKTGDSLCYAFIEFETKEACEQAYFKMDNALIDDRRIHVDFSQSVAKLWSQYRRKDNQMGRAPGKGCFKCGALDHKAKDCMGDPATKHQPPKYILRDSNMQHGGDDNSRYDMVFEGETPENPRPEKMHRGSRDLKPRDWEKNDSSGRHRQSDRHRGYGEDNLHHESKEGRHRHDQRDRERLINRRKESDDYGRDDRDYKKRSSDIEGTSNGKDNVDGRKRSEDNDKRRERKEDGDDRKRSRDYDSRAEKRESDYRKRDEDADYRKRGAADVRKRHVDDDRLDTNDQPIRRDYDGYKGSRDGREDRRRSADIDYGREHDRDRRHRSDKRR